MLQIINIDLERQDPKPAAIYVVVVGSSLLVGCAYDTHTYTMKLFDRNYDNYFRYCKPCKFRRSGHCPGGEAYLFGSPPSYTYLKTPDSREISISKRLSCLAQTQELITVKKNTDVTQVVKLPAYVLWNSQHADSNYEWWILNPEASTIDEMWSGFPFPFANVHENGKICMGDEYIENCYGFAEFQSKLLNGRFNTDLRMYEPQFQTLGSYARALSAEANQVQFLNNFAYSSYQNFAKKMVQVDNYAQFIKRQAILPPIYEKIKWDSSDEILSLINLEGNEFTLTNTNEVVG